MFIGISYFHQTSSLYVRCKKDIISKILKCCTSSQFTLRILYGNIPLETFNHVEYTFLQLPLIKAFTCLYNNFIKHNFHPIQGQWLHWSQQYINIQCTTYKQIQNTIEQMESCAPVLSSKDCLMKEPKDFTCLMLVGFK